MRKSLKLIMSAFTVCITLYMLSCTIHAVTYYVSATTGNDSRTAAQAQSTSTPWKTISKQLFVNGEMITKACWSNNTSTQLLQLTLAAADSATNTSISDAELNQANDFWNGASS